jgi:predicted transcriptional regulator
MKQAKHDALHVRVDGELKDHVCRLAEVETRSKQNMTERLLIEAINHRSRSRQPQSAPW